MTDRRRNVAAALAAAWCVSAISACFDPTGSRGILLDNESETDLIVEGGDPVRTFGRVSAERLGTINLPGGFDCQADVAIRVDGGPAVRSFAKMCKTDDDITVTQQDVDRALSAQD